MCFKIVVRFRTIFKECPDEIQNSVFQMRTSLIYSYEGIPYSIFEQVVSKLLQCLDMYTENNSSFKWFYKNIKQM